MKQIVFCLLFFFVLAWGWEAAGEYPVPAERDLYAGDTGEAKQKTDVVFSVLMEANRYADTTIQQHTVPGLQLARRYRPAGFSMDKWFVYLTAGQQYRLKESLKLTFLVSQEYAACRKDDGYFIYHLRKIVI